MKLFKTPLALHEMLFKTFFLILVLAVVLRLGAQLFYQFGWTRKKENKRIGGSVLGPYLGPRAILCVKEQTQS